MTEPIVLDPLPDPARIVETKPVEGEVAESEERAPRAPDEEEAGYGHGV